MPFTIEATRSLNFCFVVATWQTFHLFFFRNECFRLWFSRRKAVNVFGEGLGSAPPNVGFQLVRLVQTKTISR
jgi:hypothetical protein